MIHHRRVLPVDIILEIIKQSHDFLNHNDIQQRRDSQKEFRRSLARMACVCKSFYGPSVKALWAILPSIDPLLRLLSQLVEDGEQAVGEPRMGFKVQLYRLSGDILDEDWARFRAYAAVVREIEDDSGDWVFPRSTWDALKQRAGGNPLLPSLRSLMFSLNAWDNYHGLLQLVPPTLHTLTLRAVEANNGIAWRDLFSVVPQLKIWHYLPATDEAERISLRISTIPTMRHLRECRLWTRLGIDDLQALSLFEALEMLDISIDIGEDPSPVTVRGFDQLQRLKIFDWSGKVEKLFEMFSSESKLRELDISNSWDSLPMVEEWGTACTMLAQRFPSLEQLGWSLMCDDDEENPPLDVSSGALIKAMLPLFALRQLTVVRMDFEWFNVEFTDDLFNAFASGWPNLVKFSMTEGKVEVSNKVTLFTLFSFAMRCPNLKSLRLPHMHVPSRVLSLSAALDCPLLNHTLEVLVIEKISACDTHKKSMFLALVLERFFPHLDVDGCEKAYRASYVNGGGLTVWATVLRTVAFCQIARRNRDRSAVEGRPSSNAQHV